MLRAVGPPVVRDPKAQNIAVEVRTARDVGCGEDDVSHALIAGGEPADAGRRDERFVVVDDAVEELDGEPAGVGRGDQSSNPTLFALVC